MNMMAAVRSGFRQYAQFSGRATRREFWWWILFTALVAAVLGSIPVGPAWMSHGMMMHSHTSLASLWDLAVLVPTVAVGVRRLRDAGYGWGNLFWLLIPGFGLLILTILCAQPTIMPDTFEPGSDVPPLDKTHGFGQR